MVWLWVAFTARAEDREPTEEELRQSTIQVRQTFSDALTVPFVDKLWEGTQHLFDDQWGRLGSVVTEELTPTIRRETWLTESSVVLGFGPRFLARQQNGLSTVPQETSALGPGRYQKAVMTVEYKELTQESVQALEGAVLTNARQLYEVDQSLDPSCQSGNCGLAWGAPDGWLLRVRVGTNSYQDHWVFLDSFEWEEQDGVLPALFIKPVPNFPMPLGLRSFYDWAFDMGADFWSFVEYDVQLLTQ